MQITIRKFQQNDIPKKVEWINNPENNKFLHYDLPLNEEKTTQWFMRNMDRTDRFDGVILADGIAIGLIGLLGIDKKNSKAEFYIAIGETSYKGKGVAKQATQLLLKYAFEELELNRVYFFTETENIIVQKMFERIGFKQEGLLEEDILSHGKLVSRYVYALLKKDWQVHV